MAADGRRFVTPRGRIRLLILGDAMSLRWSKTPKYPPGVSRKRHNLLDSLCVLTYYETASVVESGWRIQGGMDSESDFTPLCRSKLTLLFFVGASFLRKSAAIFDGCKSQRNQSSSWATKSTVRKGNPKGG